MKNKGLIIILLTLVLLICPLASLGGATSENADEKKESETQKISVFSGKNDGILVFSPSNKKVKKLDLYEYVVGSVSAEIPPTYHTEAIKAQAVASYTYALKTRESGKNEEIGGAHISASSEKHQGYIDKKERKKRWGDKFDVYEKKIEGAVKEVFGEKITYNGELIIAAYHAISSGSTFSAHEVWGREVPYLVSVSSAGDRLSPEFADTVVYTESEFKKAVEEIDGVDLSPNPKDWVGKITASESGYVEYVEIGDKKIKGRDLRETLNLKSASFNIEYADNNFKIMTKGYGHGVGMSQYGADFMARQGKNYKEILEHYYSNVKIEK